VRAERLRRSQASATGGLGWTPCSPRLPRASTGARPMALSPPNPRLPDGSVASSWPDHARTACCLQIMWRRPAGLLPAICGNDRRRLRLPTEQHAGAAPSIPAHACDVRCTDRAREVEWSACCWCTIGHESRNRRPVVLALLARRVFGSAGQPGRWGRADPDRPRAA
jgi:hypothetical protein